MSRLSCLDLSSTSSWAGGGSLVNRINVRKLNSVIIYITYLVDNEVHSRSSMRTPFLPITVPNTSFFFSPPFLIFCAKEEFAASLEGIVRKFDNRNVYNIHFCRWPGVLLFLVVVLLIVFISRFAFNSFKIPRQKEFILCRIYYTSKDLQIGSHFRRDFSSLVLCTCNPKRFWLHEVANKRENVPFWDFLDILTVGNTRSKGQLERLDRFDPLSGKRKKKNVICNNKLFSIRTPTHF
jgi:hypothetical protein